MRYILALLLMTTMLPTYAKGPSVTEIKAAFIFRLANYVEWQNPYNTQKTLCFTNSEKGSVASILKSKIEKSKKFSSKFNIVNSKDAAVDCLLTYITEDLSKADINSLSENSLLVGDNFEFLDNGGTVSLVLKNNKVRIYVNKEALKKSNVKINSQLLSLVRFYPN